MNVQDTYILEAGLQNDVELPYTCRGGICGCVLPVLPVDFFTQIYTRCSCVCLLGYPVLQGILMVTCHCRACVGRVVEGEVDMSDVSHRLITFLRMSHGLITAMQLQNHPLHLLLEALHHVYKDGFYMMRSGSNFGSCRSACILRASMHLQITDLTFTLDEEEVEKVCPLRPARQCAQCPPIRICPAHTLPLHEWL